jgi:hypothetical protein
VRAGEAAGGLHSAAFLSDEAERALIANSVAAEEASSISEKILWEAGQQLIENAPDLFHSNGGETQRR